MSGKLFDISAIALLLLTASSLCICDPRSPRIYNVLISTKKNLAPSQAVPVYEPVLRTTSLGLAFSPLYYTPISTIQSSPTRYVHEGPVVQDILNTENQQLEQTKESVVQENYVLGRSNQLQSPSNGGIKNLPQNVVPLQQYIPYYTSPQLTYQPYYPKKEEEVAENNPQPKALEEYYENVNDPKQIVANLKKNSDIPDVPPPPLPVRNL